MKIIFICPNYHKYGEKIAEKIREYSGAEVLYLSHSPFRYKYKNIFEKLYNNFFLKIFTDKSLKKIKEANFKKESIENFGRADLTLVIRPDFYSYKIMELLKKNSEKMVLHFWDSIKYEEKQKEYIKYFDYLYSFDKKESEEYNMQFLPNFYFEPVTNRVEILKYDIFLIMGYDERFTIAEKIAKVLKEKNISYKIIIVTDREIESDYLEISKNSIPLDEVIKLQAESKVFLEIGHTSIERPQGGLSMRAIEALGNKKKLITTYSDIKEYDFYKESNIKILEGDNIDIDDEFFKSPYEDVGKEIYEKYSLKNWIMTLLKNE